MDILRFSRDHDLRTTVVIPPVFQANYDAVCSLAMELLNAIYLPTEIEFFDILNWKT